MKPVMSFMITIVVVSALGLNACGSGSDMVEAVNMKAGDCPPPPSDSLSALKRAGGLENMQKYSQWLTELPPKSCAGPLATYIPDLPDGFALQPGTRPPVMTDDRVYMRFAPMPDDPDNPPVVFLNEPGDGRFEFEITQLSQEELDRFRTWLAENEGNYRTLMVEGRTFYMTGGGVLFRRGNALTGGVTLLLDNGVMTTFTMPGIYTSEDVPRPVARIFHDIAFANGQ